MISTECHHFIEDLGAHAAGAGPLRAEAATHVRRCALCQRKLAELSAAAALQFENAQTLPRPTRSFPARALHRAIVRDSDAKDFSIALRPVFACAVVIAVVALVILGISKPRESRTNQAVIETHARPTQTTDSSEPTLGALRRAAETGGEQLLASAPVATGLKHYRVKDVESELRN